MHYKMQVKSQQPQIYKTLKRIEEDRTLYRRIKPIEGKFKKLSAILVTQQQTYGSTLESTDKIPLEIFIIKQNLKKYQQTNGACPLLDDTCLYLDIVGFGEGPQLVAIMDGTYVWQTVTIRRW